MPERRGGARLLGAIATGLLIGALAAPAALAQTDDVPDDFDPGPTEEPPPPPEQQPPGSWEASSFDEPFDEDDPRLRRATFDVGGTMRYQKTGPADFIEEVEVRVVDDPADGFTPGEGCALPEPTTITGDFSGSGGVTAEQAFLVEGVTVDCNGRYLVQAEGRLEDPEAPPHTMERSFVLAALPESVTGLAVTVDGQARAVTVTFRPLAEDELSPDAIGYVLERSDHTGGGTFTDVGTLGLDDEARFVDPLTDAPAGAYTYRVRAVRAGVDGDVRSSVIHTESDTVEVEGDPASGGSPTTEAGRTGSVGSRSGGRVTMPRRSSAPRLTTPTTLDTGFEDTLDYGEAPPDSEAEELAGDEPVAGQSIVQDEGEDMDLAVPAAGALVMLGWAGHILYLNRLAKQL